MVQSSEPSSARNGNIQIHEVNRVRGKNIIWLPLIAMLFSILVMTPGFAKGGARLQVAPTEVYGEPGDRFSIDIEARNVKDLYTFGFAVQFVPHAWTLVVTTVTEGPFLGEGGYDTDFYYTVDTFAGYVYVTGTRLGPTTPGVSGTGIVATVGFAVEGVGESPLDLVDTELFDSTGALMGHTVKGSYYYGPRVDLLDDVVDVDPGRKVNVNYFNEVRFTSAVHNPGTMPLYVMTQFSVWSEDTLVNVQNGQTYIGDLARATEYLYVNSYTPWL
jgi:hypothetical protein